MDVVDRDVDKYKLESPTTTTEEAHLRKTKSVQTARELFDVELRRGAYPSLRRGEQQPTAPASASAADSPAARADQADSSASGLFFLVVERGLGGCGVLGDSKPSSGGAKRSVDNAVVVSPSSGESLPYPWAEAGVLPEDAAATSASLLVPGNPRGGDGDDDDGSPAETSFQEDEGDGPCADAEVDGRSDDHCGHSHDRDRTEYTVPYWAIMRVGEVTRDPDDDPDPWPLLGVDVGGVGVGDRNARKKPSQVSPLPPTQHLQYPQQQSFRKPLTRAVSPSPGYSVVIINVKVSVHHPRGSAVASNKDAVIEGITKVSQSRRLESFLRKSLTAAAVSCVTLGRGGMGM